MKLSTQTTPIYSIEIKFPLDTPKAARYLNLEKDQQTSSVDFLNRLAGLLNKSVPLVIRRRK
jgi:hypothetical protein